MKVSLVKRQTVNLRKSAVAHYSYSKPPLTYEQAIRPSVWAHLRFPAVVVAPFAPALLAWMCAGPNAGWLMLPIGFGVFAYVAAFVINAAGDS